MISEFWEDWVEFSVSEITEDCDGIIQVVVSWVSEKRTSSRLFCDWELLGNGDESR